MKKKKYEIGILGSEDENSLLSLEEDALLALVDTYEEMEDALDTCVDFSILGWFVLNAIVNPIMMKKFEWFSGVLFMVLTSIVFVFWFCKFEYEAAEAHTCAKTTKAAIKKLKKMQDGDLFDLSLIGFGKGAIKPEPRPLPEVDEAKIRQEIGKEAAKMATN